MPSDDEIAKVIADNLPSPMALDIVWRQKAGGDAEFDLNGVDPRYVEEWYALVRAVRNALSPNLRP